SLRQRAWVEDNRRKVDALSHGRLGYVWVPNTGGPGFVSFNRYFFAQQDKQGAVIDERFNGGGLLDDYMVDLMVRRLRADVTNEAPGGAAFRLPAGILGPKVLLINELAGSGGDFFPWIFRHQQVGPLIGTRTWGGLVAAAVHYSFVDGGAGQCRIRSGTAQMDCREPGRATRYRSEAGRFGGCQRQGPTVGAGRGGMSVAPAKRADAFG